jgi:hypothetical protein
MPGRRPRAPRPKIGLRALLRIAAVLLAAAALLWITVTITAAGVFRDIRPAWALKVAPWDARANAAFGLDEVARQPSGASVRDSILRAQNAFRRDPTALRAITGFGFGAALERDQRRADAIFAYAERLSRRDPETQLWLIERSVRQNDIPGALSHYDKILRTSPAAWTNLFPILIDASSNPPIAQALNRMLRTNPVWGHDFLLHLADSTRDAQAIYTVSRGLLRPEPERQHEVLVPLLKRLVTLGRPDLGQAAFEAAVGRGAHGDALVRDGEFRNARGLPPFDWDYADDGQLNPERRPREGAPDAFALYLPSSPPQDGQSARQLLRLPPGSYEVRAAVGAVPAEAHQRPYLRVYCAETQDRTLVHADFPVSAPAMAARFTVPANCPNQWLSIWVRGDLDSSAPVSPWIGSIAVRRL